MTNHRRNCTHCPIVLRARERAAADMHVGELQHFEISVGVFCERPMSEFIVKSRRKLFVLGVFHFFKVGCEREVRVGVDGRRNRATAEEYNQGKHDAAGNDQRFDGFSLLLFGRKGLFLFFVFLRLFTVEVFEYSLRLFTLLRILYDLLRFFILVFNVFDFVAHKSLLVAAILNFIIFSFLDIFNSVMLTRSAISRSLCRLPGHSRRFRALFHQTSRHFPLLAKEQT